MIKLDILSDPICPWGYIGKANLDRALARHPGHPFEIEWHPFQLNPDMPEGGVGRRAYLEAKFGGPEAVDRADVHLKTAAEAAGVVINFDAIRTTPNTVDAHRLIHWAGLEGRQTAVVSALFKANFVEGRDIGQREVLLDIAEACGLDRAMTERLYETDADLEDIRARDAHARARGVTGVPTFIVAQKYAVVGAQPPELWDRVINDLAAQDSAGSGS